MWTWYLTSNYWLCENDLTLKKRLVHFIKFQVIEKINMAQIWTWNNYQKAKNKNVCNLMILIHLSYYLFTIWYLLSTYLPCAASIRHQRIKMNSIVSDWRTVQSSRQGRSKIWACDGNFNRNSVSTWFYFVSVYYRIWTRSPSGLLGVQSQWLLKNHGDCTSAWGLIPIFISIQHGQF